MGVIFQMDTLALLLLGSESSVAFELEVLWSFEAVGRFWRRENCVVSAGNRTTIGRNPARSLVTISSVLRYVFLTIMCIEKEGTFLKWNIHGRLDRRSTFLGFVALFTFSVVCYEEYGTLKVTISEVRQIRYLAATVRYVACNKLALSA
jgi:hypothetical protein